MSMVQSYSLILQLKSVNTYIYCIDKKSQVVPQKLNSRSTAWLLAICTEQSSQVPYVLNKTESSRAGFSQSFSLNAGIFISVTFCHLQEKWQCLVELEM